MDTPENIDNTKEGSKQLGELLVSYREKVGMDIDQAADAMCLTRGTLEALENEDFHLLPEAPYIRGYLRGYAKLADVSSADAVALYESIAGGDGLTKPNYHFTPSAKTDNLSSSTLSSSVLRLGGGLLLLVILAVVSTIPGVKDWAGEIWSEFSSESSVEKQAGDTNTIVVQNGESAVSNSTQLSLPKNTETLTLASSDKKPAEDDNSQQTEISSNNLAGNIKRDGDDNSESSSNETDDPKADSSDAKTTNETETESAEESNGTSSDEKDDAATKTDVDNLSDDTSSEGASDSTDAAEETTDDSDAQTDSTENTDESTNDTDAEASDKIENDEAPETTTVDLSDVNIEAGEVAIKLVFEDEVWMRIKKKGGKQVFEGLRQKGEEYELKAVKPLDFKVGNAPGVKIYINGQLYDQSPHQRGVVSRFDYE